jgi:hypothetical protein
MMHHSMTGEEPKKKRKSPLFVCLFVCLFVDTVSAEYITNCYSYAVLIWTELLNLVWKRTNLWIMRKYIRDMWHKDEVVPVKAYGGVDV